ncbi:hypothetical protein ACQY0O_008078 [Thecaphora frezii]
MTADDDDDDEFDAFFDDAPLDPELEQSLAQLEATYTATQSLRPAPPPPPPPPQRLAAPAPPRPLLPSSGVRRGAFVSPQKRQKLANPSTLARHPASAAPPSALRNDAILIIDDHDARTTRPAPQHHHHAQPNALPPSVASRHQASRAQPALTARNAPLSPAADQVIVHNLRHDEFGDADDEWWSGNNGLDHAEQEAIRMSQQPASQQPAHHHLSSRQASAAPAPAPARPPNTEDEDIVHLRRQLQELQKAARRHEETIRRLASEKQAKEGEVTVVRQNLHKLNLENAKLREKEVRMEQEHKAALETLHADNQRQMERLETATAFRRVEQDTSRRAWPSSVRRLPPSTLRERDRRQESQVALGLTTPTKHNRNGGRTATPGSSSSRTPRTLGRAAFTDRPEPASPSKRAAASHTHAHTHVHTHAHALPMQGRSSAKAKGKSQVFSKFQNSFGDPDLLPPKFRPAPATLQLDRTTSPTKGGAGSTSLGLSQDAIDITMDEAPDDVAALSGPSRPPETPSKRHTAADAATSGGGGVDAVAHRRRRRYLWAVGELVRRRSELVGQVLGHACDPPSPPLSHPRTRYNPKGSLAGVRPAASRPYAATIYRLINAEIPASAPAILLRRYALTTQYLNAVLTQGSASDGEERFHFLLQHDDGWEEGLEDGMRDLLEGLAAALQTLMGLFLRLCMVDCLRDTLKMAHSLCVAHPALAEKLMTPQDGVWSYKAHEARDAHDAAAEVGGGDVDTPRSLTLILVEAIRKCNIVGISVSSPSSVLAPSEAAAAADSTPAQAQTQARRQAQRERVPTTNGETVAAPQEEAWDMGDEAREELVEAVLDVLEVVCWALQGRALEPALRFIGETDGFLYTLLDRQRRSWSIERTVRLMAAMVDHSSLIHACLAAKPDPQLRQMGHVAASSSSSTTAATTAVTTTTSGGRPNVRSAKLGVLNLLAKHLVDRRFDQSEPEWHSLHRSILILLTQAALKGRDTHIILADSAALLAALVKCLSLDADVFWNEGVSGIKALQGQRSCEMGKKETTDETVQRIVERLRLDVGLLAVLYRYPLPPPAAGERSGEGGGGEASSSSTAVDEEPGKQGIVSLSTKLQDPETQTMLNGVRQSFIVALNRIAFAPEPEWMDEERALISSLPPSLLSEEARGERLKMLAQISLRLETVADLAGDLVDLVLTPEEVEEVWNVLADEGAGGREEVDMEVDKEELEKGEGGESETETEPESPQTGPRGKKRTEVDKSRKQRKVPEVVQIVDSDED